MRRQYLAPDGVHRPEWLDETGRVNFVAFPLAVDVLAYELGDFLGGLTVYWAIDPDDSTERRDGVARKGFLICLKNRISSSGTAGIRVFDDDDGRGVELLREFPAGIEVDEVVVAEFLALQLAGTCDAKAGGVGVERGTLMRVFAVTEGLREGHVDTKRVREHLRCG